MARPKAKQLTERELEIMHVYWNAASNPAARSSRSAFSGTVSDVRAQLAENGRDLAYTTVATLVRILAEKKFLTQTSDQRPFSFRPAKSFQEVSGRIVGDLVDRVFSGSREALLVRLVEQKKLTKKERELLEQILRGKK